MTKAKSIEWSFNTLFFITCFKESTYKTTAIYDYTPIGVVKVEQLTIWSADEEVEKLDLSRIAIEIQNDAALLENCSTDFYKVKTYTDYI